MALLGQLDRAGDLLRGVVVLAREEQALGPPDVHERKEIAAAGHLHERPRLQVRQRLRGSPGVGKRPAVCDGRAREPKDQPPALAELQRSLRLLDALRQVPHIDEG